MNIKYYHGSKLELQIGLVLTSSEDRGYTSDEVVRDLECLFERFKPKNKTSRKLAVYMVDNPNDIDYLGGYNDYVYQVVPCSKPDKSDLTWYSKVNREVGDFFDPSEKFPMNVIDMINNYWQGIPSENPLWEYRVKTAKVLKEENQSTLIC